MELHPRKSCPYHEKAFKEALNNNAMIVMAKGLGILRLISMFAQLFCKKTSLTFILNADHVAEKILYELKSVQVPPEDLPRILTNKTSGDERMKMYNEGGCFILTSRVLILDLLQKRVQPKCITGFLVYDAHRVTELSIEAFILRIFRRGNRTGFVKAFCDEAVRLSKGFGKTKTIMKCLGVKTIYLWPRFHKDVSGSLEPHAPEVIELAQPLSKTMEKIQMAIVKVMEMCLRHLGNIAQIDVTECTVAKGLLESFDAFLMERLNPQWSSLDYKSKQLVSDIRLLRRLLHHLLNFDCVTFNRFLLAVRDMASQKLDDGHFYKEPSPWLLSDAADVIFDVARLRVYKLTRKRLPSPTKGGKGAQKKVALPQAAGRAPAGKKGPKEASAPSRGFKTTRRSVLEENPKWKLLKEVIGEVLETAKAARSSGAAPEPMDNADPSPMDKRFPPVSPEPPILILGNTPRACREAVRYLVLGGNGYLNRVVAKYAYKDKALKNLLEENQAVKALAADDVDNFIRGVVGAREARSSILRKERQAALASFAKKPLPPDAQGERSVEGGGVSRAPGGDETVPSPAVDHDVNNEGFGTIQDWWESECKVSSSTKAGQPLVRIVEESIVALPESGEEIAVGHFLKEAQPTYIVLYNPNPKVIREIEVFANENPHKCIRVYFLIYEATIEEQQYLASLKSERDAFLQLIDYKSHVVVQDDIEPEIQDGVYHVNDFTTAQLSKTLKKSSSRNAGGKFGKEKPNRVICDVREFRSGLPSMLDLKGMEVVPITLTVGDYILTPDLVVERKSLSDLYGSFASGRLVTQVEAMSRHFRQPSLLIEFSADREFRLTHSKKLPSDIRVGHIISRMVLLTIHFPHLRLIWMRSPRATASMFQTLKEKGSEPDVAGVVGTSVAAAGGGKSELGSASSANAGITAVDAKLAPADMLLRVPGVTRDNARGLSKIAPTLVKLSMLDVVDLKPVVGIGNAKKIYNFFNAFVDLNGASGK
jgi:DNA excision repair protein ERCC-4|eukprot:g4932.t1